MSFQIGAVCERKDSACSSNSSLDRILRWFSHFHPWDFITSQMTEGKPNWITINKYPLRPETLYELWDNPNQLVGVRFKAGKEATTSYLVIDIDFDSALHPDKNPGALRRMAFVLEDIGLCRYILVASSRSEGLHLYFPLSESLPCYGLALAVRCKLEEAGFEVAAGQLEIFPNVKTSRNYNAHRLPLQSGSYVLNSDFQPVHNNLIRLIAAWDEVAKSQDINLLRQAIATTKRVFKKANSMRSGNALEWRNRLEDSLETGWTGRGQTNRIIKEACTYARVFRGLDWDAAYEWVRQTVVDLPGYQKFCKHRHEIKRRVKDWVKSNRRSGRYFPYGSLPRKVKVSNGPSNEERSANALKRIKNAIATLVEQLGQLPQGVRKRQILICKTANCSASTLRKHLTLWHPEFEDQGATANDSDKLSAISEEFKLTRTYSNLIDEHEEDTTNEPKEVVGNYEHQSSFHKSSEIQSHQGVTHPPLLSVSNSLELAGLTPCSPARSKKEFSMNFSFITDLILQENTGNTIEELEPLNQKFTNFD